MKLTRTSPFTGITRTLDIACTQAQIDLWKCGVLLRNAFPNLSPDDREFIKSGITGEEWDIAFGHGNFSKLKN